MESDTCQKQSYFIKTLARETHASLWEILWKSKILLLTKRSLALAHWRADIGKWESDITEYGVLTAGHWKMGIGHITPFGVLTGDSVSDFAYYIKVKIMIGMYIVRHHL